eukprot:2788217-Amphidinium_carterae.2
MVIGKGTYSICVASVTCVVSMKSLLRQVATADGHEVQQRCIFVINRKVLWVGAAHSIAAACSTRLFDIGGKGAQSDACWEISKMH